MLPRSRVCSAGLAGSSGVWTPAACDLSTNKAAGPVVCQWRIARQRAPAGGLLNLPPQFGHLPNEEQSLEAPLVGSLRGVS